MPFCAWRLPPDLLGLPTRHKGYSITSYGHFLLDHFVLQLKKFPTLCCTAALVPRHRFPVASALTQPQIASSALKSGL
jgi:hypothetical protein